MLDKFIRDKHGHIAMWQTPNIPLVGWAVFALVQRIVSSGQTKTGLQFFSTAFLFTWAYLEIKDGASYFRRLLGLVVFIAIIFSKFS